MLLSASIVTYTAATGPAGELATYLASFGTRVLLIRHPLPEYFQSDRGGRADNRSRGSVGNAQRVTGPATSGAA